MMVGSELPTPETRESSVTDIEVLELQHLTVANPEGGARNLLDDVGHGGDTQLPALLGPIPLGGTFSPLTTGSVAGIEVTFQL